MPRMIELVAGIALGALYVLGTRRLMPRYTMQGYALGLIGAAVIYVAFALIGNAAPRWMAIELAGLVGYAAIAWVGLRYSPWWLAAGWLGHMGWDIGGHFMAGTPAFVPAWYPVVCLGFDVYVAGIIAMSLIAASKHGIPSTRRYEANS